MNKFKYIFVFLSLFVINFSYLNAEENFEITCKYKNPYGGSDIVLIGTNYQNDHIDNYTGKSKKEYGLKAEGSSFSKIIIVSQRKGHGEQYWALKDNFMSFSGRNWLFATVNVMSNGGKNDSGQNHYKCDDLYYFEMPYGYDGTKVTILDKIDNKGKCLSDSTRFCKKLELLTKDIYNPEKPSRELVSTCSYDFKGVDNKKEVNVNIIFSSYSDGSLYYTLDDSTNLVNFNKQYPINTAHEVNGNLRNFMLTKEQIDAIVKMDSNYKFTCSTNLIGCFGTGGIFYTFETYEEFENSKVCTDNAGNVSMGDSSNAEVVDTSDKVGDFLNPDISKETGSCEDYLGLASVDGTIANLLDGVYFIIKVGSIILVIIMSMLEFASSTTKSKDELMVTVRKLVIRLIILVILLLLPTFIDLIGNMLGKENILCGIK